MIKIHIHINQSQPAQQIKATKRLDQREQQALIVQDKQTQQAVQRAWQHACDQAESGWRLVVHRLGLSLGASMLFGYSALAWAVPIVIEGRVPDQATKQALISKLATVYPAQDIVDKIQVGAVSAPQGWRDSVSAMLTPDLKHISQGQFSVNGTAVHLRGKIANAAQIQTITTLYQSLVQPPYRLNAQLSAHQVEQQLLDNTLKNRIVEFESGSAILTATGSQILNEMVVALNKLQDKNIKIIGHTDNVGQSEKNLVLSQSRAQAVKAYLISKGIAATRLSLAGLGADRPVADNTTAEGRKKNRRIEFEVL